MNRSQYLEFANDEDTITICSCCGHSIPDDEKPYHVGDLSYCASCKYDVLSRCTECGDYKNKESVTHNVIRRTASGLVENINICCDECVKEMVEEGEMVCSSI